MNPQNLQVLNWVQLKENIVGRVTTTVFKGHNYSYVTGANQIFRYVWDGKQITQDSTWGPVTYTTAGQTPAGAPVVMNDWVVLSTNGNPAQVPLSVLAISQADGNKVARLDPTQPCVPGRSATTSPKCRLTRRITAST